MILLKIINYNLKKKNRLARVSHSMSRIYDSAKYIRIDIKILLEAQYHFYYHTLQMQHGILHNR